MVEASLLADRVGGGGEIVLDTIFNAMILLKEASIYATLKQKIYSGTCMGNSSICFHQGRFVDNIQHEET